MLNGKVAIVTGGTSGIGERIAELFVQEGAQVVIAGRRTERGEAVAGRLGPSACFVRADVANEWDMEALIERALAAFGRLDCLVNNAGPPGRTDGIAETDMAHFDELIAVHLRGTVLGMKHAAPAMIRAGAGSIINIASLAGHRTGFSSHLYSAAKAAVIHLTRCVAVELGERGIRVNSISPGPIVTGIFGKFGGLDADAADRATESLKALFATLQPIPRAGMPDDIARAALFLASDAAGFINGHDLVVDGGNVGGWKWPALLARRQEVVALVQREQAARQVELADI